MNEFLQDLIREWHIDTDIRHLIKYAIESLERVKRVAISLIVMKGVVNIVNTTYISQLVNGDDHSISQRFEQAANKINNGRTHVFNCHDNGFVDQFMVEMRYLKLLETSGCLSDVLRGKVFSQEKLNLTNEVFNRSHATAYTPNTVQFNQTMFHVEKGTGMFNCGSRVLITRHVTLNKFWRNTIVSDCASDEVTEDLLKKIRKEYD